MGRTSSKNSKKNKDIVSFDLSNDSKFSIFEVIIIIFISIIFGVIIGYLIILNRSPIKELKSESKISELVGTYYNIKDNYYKKVDDDILIDSAIKGMIDSLDDEYSDFMNDYNTLEFNKSIDGYYKGIGITISQDGDYFKIVDVIDDGPGDIAGLKKDDIILEINNNEINSNSILKFSELISNNSNSKVNLKLSRNDEILDIEVKLDTIQLPIVTYDSFNINDKLVGYIKISSFSSNSYTQFKRYLEKLEKKKIKSLIIDVRNNPGGQLKQTKEILSLFFNKKTVLYQVKSSKSTKKVYSLSNDKRSYPVVLLVNERSASASEILVSCFMENYKNSYVIGTNTYGKGTIQKTVYLTTGSSIKYTSNKWMTSNGLDINKKGIKPDLVIEQPLDSTFIIDNDLQLRAALERLK